jgi:hypothetical protein
MLPPSSYNNTLPYRPARAAQVVPLTWMLHPARASKRTNARLDVPTPRRPTGAHANHVPAPAPTPLLRTPQETPRPRPLVLLRKRNGQAQRATLLQGPQFLSSKRPFA